MPRRTRRALNRIRARTWSSWNWTNSGISFKKKNKLWIWLAFDRSGQRLVDWECGNRDAATLNRLLERLKPWSCTVQMTMRLTTRSCRLGGIISGRMKRWRSSVSTVVCDIGLPAFADAPVLCRKRSTWSTPQSHCLPPTTSMEQRQNSPCHCLLNTLTGCVSVPIAGTVGSNSNLGAGVTILETISPNAFMFVIDDQPQT